MKKSRFIGVLRAIGAVIPGDRLKTAFYLNVIDKPRKFARLSLNSFYRMDHIYDVLRDVKKNYVGNFSILEFGVADGYAFTKKLYATRYLGMANRVVVHGFDSFEGMPKADQSSDEDLIASDGWVEGQFKSSYDSLDAYCRTKYDNYYLHKGYFEDSITDEFLESLRLTPPVLIWIDCDYYSSSRVVFERLIPFIPSGCAIYFDDYEFNFGSRFTGEARIVHEINHGKFGEGIELVFDHELSLNSKRVYRFINLDAANVYQRVERINTADYLHRRTNDSPLP